MTTAMIIIQLLLYYLSVQPYITTVQALAQPIPRHGEPPFPLFVQQVMNWLTEQQLPFEVQPDGTDSEEHLTTTTSSYMLHLPVGNNGNTATTTTTATTATTTTTTTAVVLGLHLLPTPTCLEECRGPRDLLEMTNNQRYYSTSSTSACSGGLAYSKIIHLHQDVWEAQPRIVQGRLLAQRGVVGRRLWARQTHVRKIPSNIAMQFLHTHHLWGATKAKHSYGLYVGGGGGGGGGMDDPPTKEEELVAVATFSHRHRIVRCGRTFQSHELLRFCSQREMTVVGGISKLVTAFIRDKRPNDIVTVVDRDWGDGSGWHSVGFTTVATMDPIVMVVNPNEPGMRRHLIGAGIGPSGTTNGTTTPTTSSTSTTTTRLGLPLEILEELDQVDTADDCRAILARHNFFVVYDAGVERLFRMVDDGTSMDASSSTPSAIRTPREVWDGSLPKYAETYYTANRGIMALLREAAAAPPAPTGKIAGSGGGRGGDYPVATSMDSDEPRRTDPNMGKWLASWQSTSGSASTAKLIHSAPSSLDSNAVVEVRERSHGWRTVGLVGGATKSIYHAVYKVNPDTGEVEPEAVVSDYITIMADMFLATVQHHKQTGQRDDKEPVAVRLLHLGLGGGTLLRLSAHKLVGCHQKAVELDEGVVAVFKPLMPLVPTFELCVGDALKIQREANELAWDGIFIDIFDEDNRLPPLFYSLDYLRHLRDDLMVPKYGIVVLNLHSGGKKRQSVIDDAHQAFTQVFSNVRLIAARDSKPQGGNMVIIACDAEIPSEQVLEQMTLCTRFPSVG